MLVPPLLAVPPSVVPAAGEPLDPHAASVDATNRTEKAREGVRMQRSIAVDARPRCAALERTSIYATGSPSKIHLSDDGSDGVDGVDGVEGRIGRTFDSVFHTKNTLP